VNPDWLYSWMIAATWLFLGGWVVLLVAAYLAVFRPDYDHGHHRN